MIHNLFEFPQTSYLNNQSENGFPLRPSSGEDLILSYTSASWNKMIAKSEGTHTFVI